MSERRVIITVYGTPEDCGRKKLKEFTQSIRASVAGINDFENAPGDVIVLISRDAIFSEHSKIILVRYECAALSKGLLDSDWPAWVHLVVMDAVVAFFPAMVPIRIA